MTPFEIIIICLIYLFFYGYTIAMIIEGKEEDIWFRAFLAIVSLVLVLYAPLIIGMKVFEKLNNENIKRG